MKIDTTQLITFDAYAELYSCDEQPLSRQRVQQLVNDNRLKAIEISGKQFVNINDKIKPSKAIQGRPKLKKKSYFRKK